MKAVVIGPGRIGCGFIGQLLRASGYEITLVARSLEMAEHFNRSGCYQVRLTGAGRSQDISVDGIRALWIGDSGSVSEAIAQADVVATAVGPQNLPAVAPVIAAGAAQRRAPLNVIACENLIDAGPRLRRLLGQPAPRAQGLCRLGISGALVSRVVARRLGDPARHHPLVFVGDSYEQFVVHRTALCQPLPAIRGMVVVDHYLPWALRKLYTFSAGHATTAYLGALKGYHYVHTAIRDPEIRCTVLAAMREGQRGLAVRFGPEIAGGDRDLAEILTRFENAALNDAIVRVGRDPRRKLGAEERLVGAARLAARAGISPDKLSLASAAAFCFCDPGDPRAENLQRLVESSGLNGALKEVCGLNARRGVGRTIAECWRQLTPGWHSGSLLLRLDPHMWSWT